MRINRIGGYCVGLLWYTSLDFTSYVLFGHRNSETDIIARDTKRPPTNLEGNSGRFYIQNNNISLKSWTAAPFVFYLHLCLIPPSLMSNCCYFIIPQPYTVGPLWWSLPYLWSTSPRIGHSSRFLPPLSLPKSCASIEFLQLSENQPRKNILGVLPSPIPPWFSRKVEPIEEEDLSRFWWEKEQGRHFPSSFA